MTTRRTPRRRPNRRRHNNQGIPVRTVGMIAAGVLALGAITAGALIPRIPEPEPTVAAAIVYTTADAQTTTRVLPSDVRADLTYLAESQALVSVIRIEGDCTVKTTTVDMTPRTDSGEVLRVPSRIKTETKAKINALEAEMNTPTPGTNSRCLYQGLLSVRVPHDVPVYVFSTGIDLTPPVDARKLTWLVAPQQIVDTVNSVKEVPDLKGTDIIFYMDAPTGGQSIRVAQTAYLQDLWRALLLNAKADSVEFVTGSPGEPAATEQTPVVPLPEVPDTPIAPQPAPDNTVKCTLGPVIFEYGTDQFINEGQVRKNLAECAAVMRTALKVTVEGTVSYEGGFDANGNPLQPDYGRELAQARAARVTRLLIELGVPESVITTIGYGGVDHLPHPESPTDSQNRSVVITATGIN